MEDFTSGVDQNHLAAIGRVTISWAQLEAGLDFCVLIAHLDLGGDALIAEPPRSLSRKLEYLKTAFKRLPDLTEQRDRALRLLPEIKAASKTRHDLIHGFILSHRKTETLEVEMSRLMDWRDGHRVERKFTITTAEILEHAVLANNLANQTLALAHELLPKLSRT